jgi:hypothetical protein
MNIHEKRKEGVEKQHRYCNIWHGDGRGSIGTEVEDVMHFMVYCGGYATVIANTQSYLDEPELRVEMMHKHKGFCLETQTS